MTVSIHRVRALIRKESLPVRRDPSAFLIACVLPLLLLVIFGYGVSLDLRRVPVAVVVEAPAPEADSLLAADRNSRYFEVRVARDRRAVAGDLVAGRVSGIVVIPADFAERPGRGETGPVQVIVDGGDPNTAGLVQGYALGVWQNGLGQEAASKASLADRPAARPLLSPEPRYCTTRGSPAASRSCPARWPSP